MAQFCKVPTACPPDEIEPLVDHLNSQTPVEDTIRFPRGTLFVDGRLDLCKQDLGPQNAARILDAVGQSNIVSSILLGADFIGDQGAIRLAASMDANPNLTTVFVGCNGISPAGIEKIAEAAAVHPRLRGLWLKRNRVEERGAIALAEALRKSRTLRTVDLVSTQIGSPGLRHLLAALPESSVESLYLCGNELGPEDAKAIAAAVASSPRLSSLFVSANRLGDDGAASIIRHATSIAVLGLGSNGLGPETGEHLGKAFSKGAALRHLELQPTRSAAICQAKANRLGDEGAVALANGLSSANGLEHLDLGGNQVSGVGAMALEQALTRCASLSTLHLGGKIPKATKRRIRDLLVRNQGCKPKTRPPEDVRAIKSVYRTAPPSKAHPQKRNETPEPPLSELSIDDATLALVGEVLEQLAARPELFFEHRERLNGIRAGANRVVAKIQGESRKRKGRKTRRSERRSNRPSRVPAEPIISANTPGRRRVCYVCRRRVVTDQGQHCAICLSLNESGRAQTANLSGTTMLITGGRIKIGHEASLKLLRMGAETIVTTRFPHEAEERFRAQPDFQDWANRLTIAGLDLRNLPAVEQFAVEVKKRWDRLDALINNAALTIWRPPRFYARLVDRERTLALRAGSSFRVREAANGPGSENVSAGAAGAEFRRGVLAATESVRILDAGHQLATSDTHSSQRTLVNYAHRFGAELFPAAVDREGVPVDLRNTNSWSQGIDDVETGELIEISLVNSMAPFILTRQLAPLLERGTLEHRHVVNVSAMEGSFSRENKTPRHPHTNMAKAALNMLTRTIAEDFAQRRILVNSVDTGWITDENPAPKRDRLEQAGFQPPLTIEDGAARVLDPILRTAQGKFPGYGQFLKDYHPVRW